MSVELSQLMQLVVGQRKFLTVGSLPIEARRYFGCNPGLVYLRDKEARHIFNGHSDVSPQDALFIGLAVETGRYYEDPKRPNCTSVVYRNRETGRPYLLGLKIVDPHEVWVSTFHHTNDQKIRQRYKARLVICPERQAGTLG